jgi:hypothetical protein
MTLVSERKEDLSKTDFAVVPNPNEGIFKIRFTEKPKSDDINILVINAYGLNVLNKTEQIRDNQVELDLKGSAPGIYLIRIISSKEIIMKKFVIAY